MNFHLIRCLKSRNPTEFRLLPFLRNFTYVPSGFSSLKQNVTPNLGLCVRRSFSDKIRNSSLTKNNENVEVSTSVRETVKETTKTVSYLGVIVAGVGITAVVFFAVLRELFSSKSPNNVYTQAVKRCCDDDRIKNALGEPIKACGEENSRGRRRHTSHFVYKKGDVEYIRMKFYLKGLRENGTVHLEMKEDETGKYVYRYLFVQVDNLSKRVIVLEDNRQSQSVLTPINPDQFNYSSPLS